MTRTARVLWGFIWCVWIVAAVSAVIKLIA